RTLQDPQTQPFRDPHPADTRSDCPLHPSKPTVRPAMIRFLLFTLAFLPLSAMERSPVVSSTDPPVRFEKTGDGRWFVDFGKAAFGNVEIVTPDVRPGTKVTVHLGEAISGPTSVHRNPGGTVRYQRHEVPLRPRTPARPKLTWAPPDWMKSGWLDLPDGTGEMMPFR